MESTERACIFHVRLRRGNHREPLGGFSHPTSDLLRAVRMRQFLPCRLRNLDRAEERSISSIRLR
jgi:hypothetical protein